MDLGNSESEAEMDTHHAHTFKHTLTHTFMNLGSRTEPKTPRMQNSTHAVTCAQDVSLYLQCNVNSTNCNLDVF